MARPSYLPQMPVRVWSPFMGRAVYVTEREAALIARVQSGWKGTQRQLALISGYTLGGLTGVLRTLRKLGVLGVMVRRGRLGFTRLKLQAGVRRLGNVFHVERSTSVDSESVTTLEDISFEERESGGVRLLPGVSRYLKIDPAGWQPG